MDRQFKKKLSVIFALLIGSGIVFFAWQNGNATSKEAFSSIEERGWQDSLSVVPQSDFLRTLNSSQGGTPENTATTTTDILARELFINYAIAQKANVSTTTLSDADAKEIARTAVSKIELPKAKQYTGEELKLSSDNSSEATAAYLKELGSLFRTFNLSQTNNDISVVFASPINTIDIRRKARISENITHYQSLINGLLKMRVPSSLSVPHLHLVQKYADIQSMIAPMSEIFIDPLKGLSALSRYRNEIAGFDIIAKEYEASILKNQN